MGCGAAEHRSGRSRERIMTAELYTDADPAVAAGGEPRPPAFTDEALALRFADDHEHDLRYVAAWGRWIVYNDKQWLVDETLKHLDLARKICRTAAAKCNKPSTATALASAKTVAAITSLARADRKIAATVDQWDTDPWLLNTPTGVIDLRT